MIPNFALNLFRFPAHSEWYVSLKETTGGGGVWYADRAGASVQLVLWILNNLIVLIFAKKKKNKNYAIVCVPYCKTGMLPVEQLTFTYIEWLSVFFIYICFLNKNISWYSIDSELCKPTCAFRKLVWRFWS